MTQDRIVIDAQEPAPAVDFDFGENRFSLSGTCYPENTRKFFDPIRGRFLDHVANLSNAVVTFDLRLTYFNSSASRVFMEFFDALEKCAEAGNQVTINWRCDEGDENMEELAEDFAEDFESAIFNVVVEDFGETLS